MAEKKTTTKRRLATFSTKETISSEISDEASIAPSCMSLNSQDVVINFKDGQSPRPQISDEASTAPSFMSLNSQDVVINFKDGQSPSFDNCGEHCMKPGLEKCELPLE
ncbi:uncharacterized protein V6R79_018741 [Siganus canaliculatus]